MKVFIVVSALLVCTAAAPAQTTPVNSTPGRSSFWPFGSSSTSDESASAEDSFERFPFSFSPFSFFPSFRFFIPSYPSFPSLNPLDDPNTQIKNSTSQTEVVNGHKLTVNKTIYENPKTGGVYRIQVVHIASLDGDNERTTTTTEPAIVTTTPPSTELLPRKADENEIREELSSWKSNPRLVHRLLAPRFHFVFDHESSEEDFGGNRYNNRHRNRIIKREEPKKKERLRRWVVMPPSTNSFPLQHSPTGFHNSHALLQQPSYSSFSHRSYPVHDNPTFSAPGNLPPFGSIPSPVQSKSVANSQYTASGSFGRPQFSTHYSSFSTSQGMQGNPQIHPHRYHHTKEYMAPVSNINNHPGHMKSQEFGFNPYQYAPYNLNGMFVEQPTIPSNVYSRGHTAGRIMYQHGFHPHEINERYYGREFVSTNLGQKELGAQLGNSVHNKFPNHNYDFTNNVEIPKLTRPNGLQPPASQEDDSTKRPEDFNNEDLNIKSTQKPILNNKLKQSLEPKETYTITAKPTMTYGPPPEQIFSSEEDKEPVDNIILKTGQIYEDENIEDRVMPVSSVKETKYLKKSNTIEEDLTGYVNEQAQQNFNFQNKRNEIDSQEAQQLLIEDTNIFQKDILQDEYNGQKHIPVSKEDSQQEENFKVKENEAAEGQIHENNFIRHTEKIKSEKRKPKNMISSSEHELCPPGSQGCGSIIDLSGDIFINKVKEQGSIR